MTDVHNTETRSRNMAAIKGKDTKPEMWLRKKLFALGYRYRLHVKELPGKPDIVLPKYKTVIFVHGCFWHMHNCYLFRLPATRKKFWSDKLGKNRDRDKKNIKLLREKGWHVIIVWECAIKGKYHMGESDLIQHVDKLIKDDVEFVELGCVEK